MFTVQLVALYTVIARCLQCNPCFSVFTQLQSVQWMLVCMVVWGSGVGSIMGLFSLCMIQFVGLEIFHETFGVTCLMIALISISLGSLLGKHTLQTSNINMHKNLYICILTYVFMYGHHKYYVRRKQPVT